MKPIDHGVRSQQRAERLGVPDQQFLSGGVCQLQFKDGARAAGEQRDTILQIELSLLIRAEDDQLLGRQKRFWGSGTLVPSNVTVVGDGRFAGGKDRGGSDAPQQRLAVLQAEGDLSGAVSVLEIKMPAGRLNHIGCRWSTREGKTEEDEQRDLLE